MKNLCDLDLGMSNAHNMPLKIDDLGDGFGNLVLRNLNIMCNENLKHLPDSFDHLTVTDSCKLILPGLVQIPEIFTSNFLCVETLVLSSWQIDQFPDSFGGIACSKSLEITSFPNLTALPPTFGLHLNDRLHQHGASSEEAENHNSKASVEMEFRTKLNQFRAETVPGNMNIKVSDCPNLQELPDSFCDIQAQYADLSSNNLRALPEQIGSMQVSQKLLLNRNAITYLPESMQRIRFRGLVDLCDNQIANCPNWLIKWGKAGIVPKGTNGINEGGTTGVTMLRNPCVNHMSDEQKAVRCHYARQVYHSS